jgi:hypothetical protein
MKASILALAAFAALALPATAGTPEMSDAQWKATWASLNDAVLHGWTTKTFEKCSDPIRDTDPLKDYTVCITGYVWAGYTFSIQIEHQIYGHEPTKWLEQICDFHNYCATRTATDGGDLDRNVSR